MGMFGGIKMEPLVHVVSFLTTERYRDLLNVMRFCLFIFSILLEAFYSAGQFIVLSVSNCIRTTR